MVYDVVIVGAGFSAIGLLINLLNTLSNGTSIAVVADDSGFGRGTAYRTELHLHRLNVPAGRMSAFPDKPSDFIDWLNRRGRVATPASFVSRHDYGLYMRDTLASLLRPLEQRSRVDFLKSRAKALTLGDRSVKHLRLASGDQIWARSVVLCLGLGTASLPRLTFTEDVNQADAHARVVENPWRLGWLSNVHADDRVCILGSGLTMVDQVLSLRNHGHRGPIEILSRRGLLPHPHREAPVTPLHVKLDGQAMELSQLLKVLRRQAREADDWRCVMEGLRHHTQEIWMQLSPAKRARFMRHALAWWNIHRHRLSPQVADALGGFIATGLVNVRAGYLKDVSVAAHEVTVTYRKRGSSEERQIKADWLINCTGMERAGISHSPLLQSMHANGLLALDPHGLGILVNDQSNIMRNDSDLVPGLYAVGGLTAGRFWEIIAVPDIRVQVAKIAKTIAEASTSSQ
jgi:uncharacterized NAD(P)/FAD-binding protein YdhS